MESLLRQLERGSMGEGQEIGQSDQGVSRRRPRKSVSFDDGEQTKSKSHQGKQYYHSSDGEYEAAVAAATYAINSLSNEGFPSKKRPSEGSGTERTTSTKNKNYGDDSLPRSASDAGRKITRWLSGTKDDGGFKDEMEKVKRTPSRSQKRPEKGLGDPTRTIKWIPSLTDKYPNDEGRKKGEEKTNLNPSLGKQPSLSSLGSGKRNHAMGRRHDNAAPQVDSWERVEMDKIRKRYDRVISAILEWENGKKTKAKRKWEKKERKIESKRAMALQAYRDDITKIDKIAGGARALASERKRNDESKMREKAERRLTGKRSSGSCFGF